MKKVSDVLKTLRKTNKYSVDYVVNELTSQGFVIAAKTLYGYESGAHTPNADMFLNLCKIYNVTDFNIFYDETDTPATTHFDHTLITAYRAHPEAQASVNKLLDIEAPSIGDSTTLQSKVENLDVPQGSPNRGAVTPNGVTEGLSADLTRELNQVALDMQSISEKQLIKSKAP